jgi:Fic family protein
MKSGVYKVNFKGDVLEYKSFYPTPLQDLSFESLGKNTIDLLTKANYQLGKLNGLASNIKDINQFVAAYVRKEALYSSQIEGTQATLEDVLDSSNDENTNADIEDVISYVKGMNYAVELLDELPISSRYMKNVHRVLLNSTRGNDKNPGEFRKSQNWIGPSGSTLKSAKYIPPTVIDMEKCMSDLEKYINDENDIDELIKTALIHYQFETIHPFLDGNGRIGRMLIIIYLISKKKLEYPCLYLSYFLKRNQLEYYDRMSYVRTKDDYIQWINFFLEAIIQMSKESIECINGIIRLREENKKIVEEKDFWLLDYLETYPIIDAKKTSMNLELAYSKVNRTILRLVKLGILIIDDSSKKKRKYVYDRYMKILKA